MEHYVDQACWPTDKVFQEVKRTVYELLQRKRKWSVELFRGLANALVDCEACFEFVVLVLRNEEWLCPFKVAATEEDRVVVVRTCAEVLFRSRFVEEIRAARSWSPLFAYLEDPTLSDFARQALALLLDVELSDTKSSVDDLTLFSRQRFQQEYDLLLSQQQEQEQNENNLLHTFSFKHAVATATTVENYQRLLVAIQHGDPVLLEGPTGSGKSLLVNEAARLHGKHDDMVELQLDDQMDSKTLLGTFVCTEIPGEFRWQPGALTQAVLKGCWVFIEDIDRAPFEILAALLPLFESRKLLLPNRDQVLTAAPGFQLIATRRKRTANNSILDDNSCWSIVKMDPLKKEELFQVALAKSAIQPSLVQLLVDCFYALAYEGESTVIKRAIPGRPLSERDFFKWISRINTLVKLQNRQFLTEQERENILVEGIDCFIAGMPDNQNRMTMTKWLARKFSLAEDRIIHRLCAHKPEVETDSSSSSSSPTTITVGRVPLEKRVTTDYPVPTHHSAGINMRLLEQLAASVKMKEPVLLVGETGAGKTHMIQHLASLMNQQLIVQNMHVQSDSTELLGGYKPVQMQYLATPLYNRFMRLFCHLFKESSNQKFLQVVQESMEKRRWKKLSKAFSTAIKRAAEKLDEDTQQNKKRPLVSPTEHGSRKARKQDQDGSKEVKTSDMEFKAFDQGELERDWQVFQADVEAFERQRKLVESSFAFTFEEGALVKALRNGDWVLLDEINLASSETLERLSSLLDDENGTLALTERGDLECIKRHPNFRLFAAMNPATDFGKKDLPPALRSRFTEIYVDEIEEPVELQVVVESYLHEIPNPPVHDIVKFYLDVRKRAKNQSLLDGSNQPPRYSLRTLCRALSSARRFLTRGFGLARALYESFVMTFATLLGGKSYTTMLKLLKKTFVSDVSSKSLKNAPKCPAQDSDPFVLCGNFWLEKGPMQSPTAVDEFPKQDLEQQKQVVQDFVVTETVTVNVQSIARAISAHKYPILLQGPTSSGKTTLVAYLAALTGHKCIRINNHQHTDLQEYMGSYVTDEKGNLVFKEGVLVEAVRNGYWIVLDELNLAPSEVLEALNRLLDDNRELFIPETQQTIKPHPKFMLFATQNPPGLYGGRKILSRAFRNRFLELHVGEIPSQELETILNKRCALAPPFCKVLVAVMNELQLHRQQSSIFAGKEGFITPRDLLRWANRCPSTYEELAVEGFRLLGDRVRIKQDKQVVKQVIEKHCKSTLTDDLLYPTSDLNHSHLKIVWTSSMRRLYALLKRCLDVKEPALLVGETGCGKTTVCQVLADDLSQSLQILNCHQNTDSADILGSLRPVRVKVSIEESIHELAAQMLKNNEAHVKTMSLEEIEKACKSIFNEDTETWADTWSELQLLFGQHRSLFQWQDGPLITSMKKGDMFLLDELSLAEDAVLERLNSVLEPSRTLLLAEKGGGNDVDEIKAHPLFRILGTMNPGGDFGKRELSPALRNRFTEIWIPPIEEKHDLQLIVRQYLEQDGLVDQANALVDFFIFFNKHAQGDHPLVLLTLRDIIAWANFIVTTSRPDNRHGRIDPWVGYIHGAGLTLLDGLGLGSGISPLVCEDLRQRSYEFLLRQLPGPVRVALEQDNVLFFEKQNLNTTTMDDVARFGIKPFFIDYGPHKATDLQSKYALDSPTTCTNLARVLRAMQVGRPILLEGSPGVGKTSLISSLAARSGHKLVRINLSEQTDFADLVGADIPVTSNEDDEQNDEPKFAWSDGVFLSALKNGDWILLDELNLASQSVLEGLNAVLDHRSSIYVPELDQTFACPPTFRVFAAQNPLQQGGGRKGLPKSFLNRFTKVFVNALSKEDYQFIISQLYPEMASEFIDNMITFNTQISTDIVETRAYGLAGAPWEFNLRDIFRLCELLKTNPASAMENHVGMIYFDRLRTLSDRSRIEKTFVDIFYQDQATFAKRRVEIRVTDETMYVGSATLKRGGQTVVVGKQVPFLPRTSLPTLEHVAKCVEKQWPVLLIGAKGTGKKSLIRYLAAACRKRLHEFAITSSTDSTELLGCFEQIDIDRQERQFISDMKAVSDQCLARFGDMERTTSESLQLIENLQHKLLVLEAHQHQYRHHLNVSDDKQVILGEIGQIVTALKEREQLSEIATSLDELYMQHEQDMESHRQRGAFLWVDGTLIRAMENGEWILLNNANLCNPTVLDRLNPLLEMGGELMINECGMVNGKPRIIRPHTDFRIFLSMDPQYGEVSRAMRNRCVELAMIEPSWHEIIQSGDGERLLDHIGILSSQVKQTMLCVAQYISDKSSDKANPPIRSNFRLTPARLIKWGKSFQTYLAFESSSRDALCKSFELAFPEPDLKKIVQFTSFLPANGNEMEPQQHDQEGHCQSLYYHLLQTTRYPMLESHIVASVHSLFGIIAASDGSQWDKETFMLAIFGFVMNNVMDQGETIERSCELITTILRRISKCHDDNGNECAMLIEFLTSQLARIVTEAMSRINSTIALVEKKLSLPLGRFLVDSSLSSHREVEMTRFIGIGVWFQLKREVEAMLAMQQEEGMFQKVLIAHGKSNNNSNNKRTKRSADRFIGVVAPLLKSVDEFIGDVWNHQIVDSLASKPLDTIAKAHQCLQDTVHIRWAIWDEIGAMEDEVSNLSNLSILLGMIVDHMVSAVSVCGLEERLKGFFERMVHQVQRMDNFLGVLKTNAVESCISTVYPELSQTASSDENQFVLNQAIRTRLMGSTIVQPKPMKTAELFQFLQRVRELSYRLDISARDGLDTLVSLAHDSLLVSAKDRKLLADAVCTVRWANHVQHGDISSVVEVFAMLESRLAKRKETIQQELGGSFATVDQWALKADFDVKTNLSGKSASITWALMLLRPVVDHFLSRNLASLISLGLQQDDAQKPPKSLTTLVEYGIEFGSFNPFDIASFQDCLWRMEDPSASKRLHATISDMMLSYYNFLWKGTFNDVAGLQTDLCGHLNQTLRKSYRMEDSNGLHHGTSVQNSDYGTPKMFQDVDTQFMVQILSGTGVGVDRTMNLGRRRHHQVVSIRDRGAKLAQLQMCLAHVQKYGMGAEQATWFRNDMQILQAIWKETVDSVVMEETKQEFQTVQLQLEQHASNLVRETLGKVCGDMANHQDGDEDGHSGQWLLEYGRLWTYVSLFRIHTMLPENAIDPSTVIDVRLDVSRMEESELHKSLALQRGNDKFGGFANGPEEHHHGRYLSNRLAWVKAEIERMSMEVIFRPNTKNHTFAQFFSIVSEFCSSLGSVERVKELVDLSSVAFEAREHIWQEASAQVCSQLMDKDFKGYEDLIEPFTISLLQLKHGLRLVAQGKRFLEKERKQQVIQNARRILGSFPSSVVDLSGEVRVSHVEVLDSLLDIRGEVDRRKWTTILRGVYERSVPFYNSNDVQIVHKESWNTFQNIVSVFAEEYHLKKQEEIQAKMEAADQSVKFKLQTVKIGGDEQKSLEQGFREMFPDFHAEFEPFTVKKDDGDDDDEEGDQEMHDQSSEDEEEESKEEENGRLVGLSNEDFLGIVTSLVNLANKRNVVGGRDSLLLKSFSFGFHAASGLEKFGYLFHNNKTGAHGFLGGSLISLSMAIQDCQERSMKTATSLDLQKGKSIDLNREPFIEETILLERPLLELSHRLDVLMQEWPDNAILQQLAKLTMRLREMPVSCPLMRALVGIETLLKVANDWEMVAHKNVSIQTEMQPLINLIVRWRKLELHSWPRVLETREQLVQDEAMLWFFQVYHLTSSMESMDFDLFETMDKFLRTSTLGSFQVRLNLLSALRYVLSNGTGRKNVELLNALWNLERYYGQWTLDVHATLDRQKGPVMKKLEDHTKLAKWDDRNYFTLKESADKSHRVLHRLANEFDEILETPAYPTMEHVTDNRLGKDQHKRETQIIVELDDVNKLIAAVASHGATKLREKISVPKQSSSFVSEDESGAVRNTIGGYGEKLPKLVKRMISICGKEIFGQSLSRIAEQCDVPTELNEAIVERIHALRKPKIPQSAKQRALVDLFGVLKSEGISLTSTSTKANEMCALFAKASFDDHVFHSQVVNHDLYFKSVAQLNRLRHSVASGSWSEELTMNQVQSSMKASENLFHVIVEQRVRIAEIGDRKKLGKVEQLLAYLLDAKDSIKPLQESRKAAIRTTRKIVSSLVHMLDEYDILQKQIACSPGSASELRAFLQARGASKAYELVENSIQFASKAQEISAIIAEVKTELLNPSIETLDELADKVFVSKMDQDMLETASERIRKAHGTIQSSIVQETTKWVPTSCCNEIVILSTRAVESCIEELDAAPPCETSKEDIDSLIDGLVASLLVSVQNARQHLFVKLNEKDKDDKAISFTLKTFHELLVQTMEGLQLEKISAMASMLIEALPLHPFQKEEDPTAFQNLLLNLGSLLEQYTLLVKNMVLLASHFTDNLGRLQYLLLRVFRTLLLNGFCKPLDEEDAEEGDAGDDQEFGGTGFGDGEGKEDVADEIEDEEQLLGLKKDEEEMDHGDQSEEKNDPKDIDDGLEMNNDFDGEMHDVKEDEKEEKDDNDEEDDGEELEREMGDLDDDQNVVDEKLWDKEDEEDEDQENKQDEEKFEKDAPLSGGENQDDEMRAKDEHEEDEPKSKKKEDEEPSPEEKQKEKEEEEEELDIEDDQEERIDDGENVEDRNMVDVQQKEEEKEENELPDEMNMDEGEEQEQQEGDNEDSMDVDEDEEQAIPKEDENGGGGEEEDDNDGKDDEQSDNEAGENIEEEEEEGNDDDDVVAEEDLDNNDENMENDQDDQAKTDLNLPDNSTGDKQDEMDKAFGTDAPKPGEQDDDEEAKKNQENSNNNDNNEKRDEEDQEDKQEEQGNKASGKDNTGQKNENQDNDDKNDDKWVKEEADDNNSQDQQDNTPSEQNNKRPERKTPNPWVDPGDPMKQWHRRLEILNNEEDDEDVSPEDQLKENEDDNPGKREDDGQFDENEKKTFEFSKKEDRSATQALAPSDTNKVEVDDENDDDDAEKKEEDEENRQMVNNEEDEKVDDSEKEKNEQQLDLDEEEERSAKRRKLDPEDPTKNDKKEDLSKLEKPGGDTMKQDETADDQDENEEEEKQRENMIETKLEMLQEQESSIQQQDDSMETDENDLVVDAHVKPDYSLWTTLSNDTNEASTRLCEQLRLLLEPTIATKLQGDYRTGKRINMRRVIPYIASQFRKDKIWLRRTKPSKREYQVILAIDDSKSMAPSADFALSALATIGKALSKLEVGQVSMMKFGDSVQKLHDLAEPFTEDSGARVVSKFSFMEEKTCIEEGIQTISSIFQESRNRIQMGASGSQSAIEFRQLAFIISDGKFDSAARDDIRKQLYNAMQQRMLIVLIIVETNEEESILNTKQVSFVKGKVKMSSYLDEYPFPLYVILQDMQSLPEVLSDALRQWFEVLARND